MAKDVSNKLASSNNQSVNNPTSISDQQKVPPLRIVLNTAGNQKSSSSSVSIPQSSQSKLPQANDSTKQREKLRDTTLKSGPSTGGRVRIRLGTNKPAPNSKGSGSNDDKKEIKSDNGQRLRDNTAPEQKDNSSSKEDSAGNLGHLRRITRRSNRTVQAVGNEDEESKSSMTSTDENQTTAHTNNNSDSNSVQDSTTTNQSNPPITASASNSNTETPRRKRRKAETSESLSCDSHEAFFGFQNYKLPSQNSFELYRNIRKQVDKKLKSLNTIHPGTPYGFKEYMLNRGSYILDGNKLGNGTNLCTNEDGGMWPEPIGKYRTFRLNRVNYSIPDRAQVPQDVPLGSPLYGLFVSQEKERYRMRMQHIKEREKLTLAVEQEVIRVYNQASMLAAKQVEPFSACTMLKLEEIYNYLDADGQLIQTCEDAQQDQLVKPEGVRTRRRQHEHISSSTSVARSSSNVEEPAIEAKNDKTNSSNETQKSKQDLSKGQEIIASGQKIPTESEGSNKNDSANSGEDITAEAHTLDINDRVDTKPKAESPVTKDLVEQANDKDGVEVPSKTNSSDVVMDVDMKHVKKEEASDEQILSGSTKNATQASVDKLSTAEESISMQVDEIKVEGEPSKQEETKIEGELTQENEAGDSCKGQKSNIIDAPVSNAKETSEHKEEDAIDNAKDQPLDKTKEAGEPGDDQKMPDRQASLSEEEQKCEDKNVFLVKLQEIDEKWEKIRHEMLIRHRNEAESLHAVQKLEWEWKTKEMGACDVRTTLIIDNTLVPKLNIYSQDY